MNGQTEKPSARAAKLAEEVRKEFLRRQRERRSLERGWQLNMNFLAGNQYCGIAPDGEIEEEQPRYAWQCRRVFNHIAPAIDTRCAKLAQVRPVMTVRAATNSEQDLHAAELAGQVLRAVCEETAFDETVSRATVWSETCGTAFYKVLWDASARGGAGGVRIAALPPFELYPENLGCEGIEEQPSIMHAKAVSADEIERLYGVKVAGRDIGEFSLAPYSEAANYAGGGGGEARNVLHGCEVVIEYYRKPCADFPEGRLTIVAGDKLAYDGALPYANGENGGRTYPFVKQCAVEFSGAFFGGSIIDRMIPVQRAFNAVKNRKHEFLNRLTMGVLAVEDGSVDTAELLEEGLAPGKVLVYRQGSEPPRMLGADAMPAEFSYEEERLLDEFVLVSGVSEISSTSQNRTNISSAVGLQLLIDQDDTRLAVTTDSIRRAMKKVGRHILRLMRSCAAGPQCLRAAGAGRGDVRFSARELTCDDVVFETDGDAADSPSKRRSLLYELYNMGLLAGEDGKLDGETRSRILNALGFAGLDSTRGLAALHRAKAAEENLRLCAGPAEVDAFDDDGIHAEEHTRFLLSGAYGGAEKARFEAHIAAHEEQRRQKQKREGAPPAAAGTSAPQKEQHEG